MERHELARRLGAAIHEGHERRLVALAEPDQFQVAFATAVAGHGDVFLGSPSWGAAERAEFAHLPEVEAKNSKAQLGLGWLMIPTGGSSGRLKFARHDGYTIAAAVNGFARHFGLQRVNAFSILPLYHVSGFMAWMRAVLTQGEFVAGDWKKVEAGQFPILPATTDGWVTSLVPTQLERLLREPAAVEWLRSFRLVFLGGAPAWPELLDRAATARVPLVLSYGMTETAAMIAAQLPEEFARGDRSSGRAMPHARLVIESEDAICISGRSVFRGYYPDWRHERKMILTADAGQLDGDGRLTVLGRRDAVIISGGEKIRPTEVEQVLRTATSAVRLAVLGIPDREWGERVVAAYATDEKFEVAHARRAAERELAPAARPKQYVALPVWPTSEAGKLNRAKLRDLIQQALRTGGTGPAE